MYSKPVSCLGDEELRSPVVVVLRQQPQNNYNVSDVIRESKKFFHYKHMTIKEHTSCVKGSGKKSYASFRLRKFTITGLIVLFTQTHYYI